MTAAWIVKTFDELEDRAARLGLCLEPAACQQLAFECGEEAFAHGIIICVSDRTHRRAHAGLPTMLAERDRGVLGTLVGMMDHAAGPPRRERHVQSIEHQLSGECGASTSRQCDGYTHRAPRRGRETPPR